jgi:hypothetical protein
MNKDHFNKGLRVQAHPPAMRATVRRKNLPVEPLPPDVMTCPHCGAPPERPRRRWVRSDEDPLVKKCQTSTGIELWLSRCFACRKGLRLASNLGSEALRDTG